MKGSSVILLCQAGNAFSWSNRYRGQQLLQGISKTKSPPWRSWRQHDSFSLLAYGDCQQKCLLPSRDLMACDLRDRRDTGREIWPRICINVSSNTVHYECPWRGFRQGRCNLLRQKVSKGGVPCIRNS